MIRTSSSSCQRRERPRRRRQQRRYCTTGWDGLSRFQCSPVEVSLEPGARGLVRASSCRTEGRLGRRRSLGPAGCSNTWRAAWRTSCARQSRSVPHRVNAPADLSSPLGRRRWLASGCRRRRAHTAPPAPPSNMAHVQKRTCQLRRHTSCLCAGSARTSGATSQAQPGCSVIQRLHQTSPAVVTASTSVNPVRMPTSRQRVCVSLTTASTTQNTVSAAKGAIVTHRVTRCVLRGSRRQPVMRSSLRAGSAPARGWEYGVAVSHAAQPLRRLR